MFSIEFWVNGSALPLVDFDVGPSWAGLLPISNNTNETRQVGRNTVDGAHFPVLIFLIHSSTFGFFLLVPKAASMTSSFGTTVISVNGYKLDHMRLGRTVVPDALHSKVFSKRTGSVLFHLNSYRCPFLMTSFSLFRGPTAKPSPRSMNTAGPISLPCSGSSSPSAQVSRKALRMSRTRTKSLNSLSDLCNNSSKYSLN